VPTSPMTMMSIVDMLLSHMAANSSWTSTPTSEMLRLAGTSSCTPTLLMRL
jgi:hypothetical protein